MLGTFLRNRSQYKIEILLLNQISFFLSYHRIMAMLEDIINAPIFFQISIFVLQIAILLFELEKVSDSARKLQFSMCIDFFPL